jgi:hypothetical protein
VEGLSFEVKVEDTGRLQATVIVTWTKSDNFPTNIHASVELKDKDGFLGNVPLVGKIDGNKITILATLDRRVFEYSEIIVSTIGRIHPVDIKTHQPTGSFIVAGRAYRVRVAEFVKK